MSKLFILCYDICDDKRLYRVRKVSYPFALGGQKSALEMPLSLKEAHHLMDILKQKIDPRSDKVNLIEVDENPIFISKKPEIIFDHGVIII